MNQKVFKRKLLVVFVLVGAFAYTTLFMTNQGQSASLTSASVTLSNPRPSFRGALAAGNTAGGSSVTINTTAGDYPSTSTAQLVQGDTVRIGEAGSLASHTVTSSSPDDTFAVTPVLAAGDADTGDDVISSQSADLTVRFTTANAIPNGRFRILVPADANDGPSADGIPDPGTWDFSTSTPTVTCPTDVGSTYDFVAGTATASAITVSGADYHAFECAYSGTGAIGTAFDGSSEDYILIENLINPAPESGHTTGTADSHNIIIQHINSGFNIIDRTSVAVGIIEAVKVTATVAPQITFQIIGVASSTSVCGITTDVTTTAASVPFGELSISAFTDAAQGLSVSTNATNGYAVTALANDQLGLDGATCTGDNTSSTCIPDSVGDDSVMSHTNADDWTDSSVKGFAYTMDNLNAVSGITLGVEYDATSGGCDGSPTYCAKQFADNEDSQVAQNILSASTVADNHNAYVCYKSVISNVQSAGDYENYITYTATATF